MTKKGICCNPYDKRNHTKFQSLHEITDALIKKSENLYLKNPLEKSADGICHLCYTNIQQKREYEGDSSDESSTAKKPAKEPPSTVPCTTGESSSAQQPTRESRTAHKPTGESSTASQPMDVDVGEETENESAESDVELDDFDEDDMKNMKMATNALLRSMKIPPIDDSHFDNADYQTNLLSRMVKRLIKLFFKKTSDGFVNDKIVEQLKTRMKKKTTSYDMKIKLLSVLPKEWSRDKIKKIFGDSVTMYMIRKTKELVAINGILCETTKKIGSKTLSEDTVKKVIEFYNSDVITRDTPGKRDYKMKTNENGERVRVQTKLVLMNLLEAYELYKLKYPDDNKIGFSKFCSLRPVECELAGSAHGIHNICVCMYHQNVKMIFEVLTKNGIFKDFKSFRDLMNLMLCKDPTEACHLNKCGKCPGYYGDGGPFYELRYQFETELIERIKYKQWTKTQEECK